MRIYIGGKFVLSLTYFTFNNITYKQTYGTPMESPLSLIIAEIVMQDFGGERSQDFELPTLFYYQYVDDIVFAAQDNDVSYILNAFNDYHQKLKFTSEKECGRGLSFLDLLLYKDNKICID